MMKRMGKRSAQFVVDILGEVVVLGARVYPSEEFIRFDLINSSCISEESVSKVERRKEGIGMCAEHTEFVSILLAGCNDSAFVEVVSLRCIVAETVFCSVGKLEKNDEIFGVV